MPHSISHSISPDALLRFFVYENEDTFFLSRGKFTQNDVLKSKEIVVRNEIISIDTAKGKGGVGTFSVALGSSTNWLNVLAPGSWVMIYMSDKIISGKKINEVDSGLKMIGIIRSVRKVESLDPGTGTKAIRYYVTGEDFQSVFHSPIYLSTWAKDSPASGVIEAINFLEAAARNKPPHVVVSALAQVFLGATTNVSAKTGKITTGKLLDLTRKGQPYVVPPSLKSAVLGTSKVQNNLFTDMVTFFLQDNLPGVLGNYVQIGNTVDTWSLLKAYCHPILNEIYTDLLPVNVNGTTRLLPSLVFRAIPFSSEKAQKTISKAANTMHDGGTDVVFGASKTPKFAIRVNNRARGDYEAKKKKYTALSTGHHLFVSRDISEDEIMMFSTGKSDGERFNQFYVFPNLNQVNVQSIGEHALTQMVVGGNKDFIDPISTGRYGSRPYVADSDYLFDSNSLIPQANLWVRDLWFRSHLFENGQVQVIGSSMPVAVGTNVRFVDRVIVPGKPESCIAHVEKVDNKFEVSANGVKHFSTVISFVRLQREKRDKYDGYNYPTPLSSVDYFNQTSGSTFPSDRVVTEAKAGQLGTKILSDDFNKRGGIA